MRDYTTDKLEVANGQLLGLNYIRKKKKKEKKKKNLLDEFCSHTYLIIIIIRYYYLSGSQNCIGWYPIVRNGNFFFLG